MLARTLYAIADDETTEKIDKEEKLSVESPEAYQAMKDWFGTQWEKRAGRTLVRGHQKSNKMNIGAMEIAAQPNAAQPSAAVSAAASLADPWSGSDPWSTGECVPCTEQVNGSGESVESLDAFGKAKGKGKSKPPLPCWTCLGIGHLASLCASSPGSGEAKRGPQCNTCRGFGHMGKDCTSEGGGKHVKKKKARERPKEEEGKGSYKGKGKGFSALDEYRPAVPGVDPWSAVAAGVAAGPPMPWMLAAAPYPGSPPGIYGVAPSAGAAWDGWASAQAQWPATAPRSLSSMAMARRTAPIAEPPPPVAVPSTFSALAETPPPDEGPRQTTILDAIRWKTSPTQGSRRDFLRQKKSALSEANQPVGKIPSNIVKPDMIETIDIRTSRHKDCFNSVNKGQQDKID